MSAVDLQILQHRDLKCEMDTRLSNREECDKLGECDVIIAVSPHHYILIIYRRVAQNWLLTEILILISGLFCISIKGWSWLICSLIRFILWSRKLYELLLSVAGTDLLSKEQFVDVVAEKLSQVSTIWDTLYSDWDETLEELDISMLCAS